MIFLCARHTWCTELFFSEAPLCVRNVTLSLSQLLFVTSWSCCLLTRRVRVGGRLDVSSSRQAQRWSVVVLVLWCNWIARTVQCLALAKPSGPCIGAVQEALSRFPVPVFPSHDTPSAALPHHTGVCCIPPVPSSLFPRLQTLHRGFLVCILLWKRTSSLKNEYLV